MDDAKLLSCASEFSISWRDNPLLITRHDNHGGWLPDGKWAVCRVFSPMNPWYLGSDGYWRYKGYHGFESAREAVDFIESGHCHTPGTSPPPREPEPAEAAA